MVSLSDKVDGHDCRTALNFGVKSKVKEDKVPTLYCFFNSIKSHNARFITHSSSCTTTELSKLLTSCLTAIKNMLFSTVETGKNVLWSIKFR